MFKFALSQFSKLSHIDISHNPLGTAGIKAMMQAISNPNNLTKLNLTSCEINKIGAHHVFTNLARGASNLNTLILDHNKIVGFKPTLLLDLL
jgi:Leucine-rich repeat (LRR) protein